LSNIDKNEIEFAGDLIDTEITDVKLIKHSGNDNKVVYLYKVEAELLLDKSEGIDVVIYIKPEGDLYQVDFEYAENPVSLFFNEGYESLAIDDFNNAVEYESDELVNEMVEKAESMLEN
jgi:hypothetical protein